jgi:hypothetical protein
LDTVKYFGYRISSIGNYLETAVDFFSIFLSGIVGFGATAYRHTKDCLNWKELLVGDAEVHIGDNL